MIVMGPPCFFGDMNSITEKGSGVHLSKRTISADNFCAKGRKCDGLPKKRDIHGWRAIIGDVSETAHGLFSFQFFY